jgi:hypothetical protein
MMVGVEFSFTVAATPVDKPAVIYAARFDHYPS